VSVSLESFRYWRLHAPLEPVVKVLVFNSNDKKNYGDVTEGPREASATNAVLALVRPEGWSHMLKMTSDSVTLYIRMSMVLRLVQQIDTLEHDGILEYERPPFKCQFKCHRCSTTLPDWPFRLRRIPEWSFFLVQGLTDSRTCTRVRLSCQNYHSLLFQLTTQRIYSSSSAPVK
jgi:hypothetical protein